MGDIKYKYAFDEKGDIVSIENLTKETSKEHTFKCIACGNELRPRAIGSKHRRAHFYHKEDISCNGETYLHNLCKLHIKRHFDDSDCFNISYGVSKSCNERNCKFRNYNCYKDHETNQVDLKEFYDTCTVETTIKGFVADLLLTNSKDTSIPPILIEICVTHPCEDKKKESGLKIIEISIKTEKDIENLFSDGILSENTNKRTENKIEFISFKRNIKEKLISPISRFIYLPTITTNPFFCDFKCDIADYKIFANPVIELNIISSKYQFSNNYYTIACDWLTKNIEFKRCNVCKFHYATTYNEEVSCGLSTKYDKPIFPRIEYAEECNYYKKKHFLFNESEYKIIETKENHIIKRDTYYVMIAGSNNFDNYTFFEEKCNHLLSEKIKTHNVIILVQSTSGIINLIKAFSYKHNLLVIPFKTIWGEYGPIEIEIYKKADALIAFWDGKSESTKSLIEEAIYHGLKVKVISYSKYEETQ